MTPIFYFFESLEFRYICVLSTAVLVFFARTTWSQTSSIYCIICIYNIISISILSGLGNIHIICIICTNYIYSPWTNRGHCPHPFTMDILLYIFIKSKFTNNTLHLLEKLKFILFVLKNCTSITSNTLIMNKYVSFL